tara:strand:- start:39 stop:353 length:315 start_codon:yes stop_codon:yes gene_type:complete
MSQYDYEHQLKYKLKLGFDSDSKGPGGAVTTALCGHWNHEGGCKWPHYCSITQTDEGSHLLVVSFDSDSKDLEIVTSRIRSALKRGQIKSPDGNISYWHIEDEL